MSVLSSVVSLSRRGGRTSGQLSAPDGSRTSSDADRVSEARIIVSEETTVPHKTLQVFWFFSFFACHRLLSTTIGSMPYLI
ncbi:hypothetical protein G6F43_012317 [Rhizopus delemar]|nr:hypothetical protein G6F43_012317 [Rhizopus delemar]